MPTDELVKEARAALRRDATVVTVGYNIGDPEKERLAELSTKVLNYYKPRFIDFLSDEEVVEMYTKGRWDEGRFMEFLGAQEKEE